MVTPELKKAFAERNIETIPIEIGTQILVDELAPANHEATQVVIGSPLVLTAKTLTPKLRTFRLHRRLTLAANSFLHDHVIAERPVLPATCAMSWIANACEQLYPGYKLFSFANFKVLKGSIFDDALVSEYILELKEIAETDSISIEFEAKIWSKNQDGKVRYHFSTQLKLLRQLPLAPTYNSFNPAPNQTVPISGTSLYQTSGSALFHGPAFQGVKSVLDISPEKITTQCIVVGIGERQQGQFPVQALNPYIADVQIHSMLIWLQHLHQETCLPSEI